MCEKQTEFFSQFAHSKTWNLEALTSIMPMILKYLLTDCYRMRVELLNYGRIILIVYNDKAKCQGKGKDDSLNTNFSLQRFDIEGIFMTK